MLQERISFVSTRFVLDLSSFDSHFQDISHVSLFLDRIADQYVNMKNLWQFWRILPRQKTKESGKDANVSHSESVSNPSVPFPEEEMELSQVQAALPSNCPYKCIKYLGKGSYGFVVLAQHTKTQRQYALKFIRRSEQRTQYIQAEILNHSRIRHPHVIKVHEVFMSGSDVVMALEYANGGTLLSRLVSTTIRNKSRGITPLGMRERLVRWYFQQLLCAVDFCHKLGIVNRDIKMDNILLCGTGEKGHHDIIKLTDFGLSKDDTAQSPPNTCIGTVVYFAPEIIRVIVDANKEYDARKSDIWSCGIVLYAMVSGGFPFGETTQASSPRNSLLSPTSPINLHKTLKNMLSKKYNRIEGISEGCADLIDRLLEPNPSDRISITEVMQHPWFKEDLHVDLAEFNDKILLNVNLASKGTNQMAADFTNALLVHKNSNLENLWDSEYSIMLENTTPND